MTLHRNKALPESGIEVQLEVARNDCRGFMNLRLDAFRCVRATSVQRSHQSYIQNVHVQAFKLSKFQGAPTSGRRSPIPAIWSDSHELSHISPVSHPLRTVSGPKLTMSMASLKTCVRASVNRYFTRSLATEISNVLPSRGYRGIYSSSPLFDEKSSLGTQWLLECRAELTPRSRQP